MSSTTVMLKPDWSAAREHVRKETLEQEDCLPNPDISSVASLLHARGFHILFSSCSAHFPEPTMITKQRQLHSILILKTNMALKLKLDLVIDVVLNKTNKEQDILYKSHETPHEKQYVIQWQMIYVLHCRIKWH